MSDPTEKFVSLKKWNAVIFAVLIAYIVSIGALLLRPSEIDSCRKICTHGVRRYEPTTTLIESSSVKRPMICECATPPSATTRGSALTFEIGDLSTPSWKRSAISSKLSTR